jgi:hypothetical protein
VSFEIVPAWRQVTPALEDELVAFWQRNGVLADPARAAARAKQAVCIGRAADGALCAVGTAELRVLPRLRQPTYYYRQFFDAAHRGHRQAIPFANRAKAILQAYNAGLERAESLGMLIEVENRGLSDHFPLALEPQTGYGFIGYSPRGLVLRVSWFDGAVLQAPAPVQRGASRPAARTDASSLRSAVQA